MKISAYFFDGPDGNLDKECCRIFRSYGGESFGSGNMLTGVAAGERDVMYDVPKKNAAACKAALKRAGFRLEETPGKWDDLTGGIPDEVPVMH